ncbi:zinc finger protein, partial [Moniliophthora roreri]
RSVKRVGTATRISAIPDCTEERVGTRPRSQNGPVRANFEFTLHLSRLCRDSTETTSGRKPPASCVCRQLARLVEVQSKGKVSDVQHVKQSYTVGKSVQKSIGRGGTIGTNEQDAYISRRCRVFSLDGSMVLDLVRARFGVLGSECGFWSTHIAKPGHQCSGDIDQAILKTLVPSYSRETVSGSSYNGRHLLQAQVFGDEDEQSM